MLGDQHAMISWDSTIRGKGLRAQQKTQKSKGDFSGSVLFSHWEVILKGEQNTRSYRHNTFGQPKEREG